MDIKLAEPQPVQGLGTVISSTRRYIALLGEDGTVLQAKSASRSLEICVGDLVRYSVSCSPSSVGNWEAVVTEMLERKNLFKRSYGSKIKLLAANLDRVLIVTAPLPLFNTMVIDRVALNAYLQGISCSVVVNKIDLEQALGETKPLIETYRRLGLDILFASAKTGEGMPELIEYLSRRKTTAAVLVGVSGVGKSSLLNRLIPQASLRTDEVSRKTGQGRQVTSSASGHLVSFSGGMPTLLIDLPGIQNFGLAHISREDVLRGFVEIADVGRNCRFQNCTHREEPDCAVKQALPLGSIAQSRYFSYCTILDEIMQHEQAY